MGVSGVIDLRATPALNCPFTDVNNTRQNTSTEHFFMISIFTVSTAQITKIN